jgi:hypothetical protein
VSLVNVAAADDADELSLRVGDDQRPNLAARQARGEVRVLLQEAPELAERLRNRSLLSRVRMRSL